MATAVVSGRIDAAVKEQAGAYIHAAGLSTGDVIKTVWENIAKTGRVPTAQESNAPKAEDPFEGFVEFCDALPPAPTWLVDLNDAQMNEMMAARHA